VFEDVRICPARLLYVEADASWEELMGKEREQYLWLASTNIVEVYQPWFIGMNGSLL